MRDSLNNHNSTTLHHQESPAAGSGCAEAVIGGCNLHSCIHQVLYEVRLHLPSLKTVDLINLTFHIFSFVCETDNKCHWCRSTASRNNCCAPLGHTDNYNFYQLGLPSLTTRGHSGFNKKDDVPLQTVGHSKRSPLRLHHDSNPAQTRLCVTRLSNLSHNRQTAWQHGKQLQILMISTSSGLGTVLKTHVLVWTCRRWKLCHKMSLEKDAEVLQPTWTRLKERFKSVLKQYAYTHMYTDTVTGYCDPSLLFIMDVNGSSSCAFQM